MTWKPNLAETKRHYVDWWNHRGIVLNMWEHFQQGVKPHGPYAAEIPIVLTEQATNDFGTGSFNLPGAPRSSSLHQRWFDPAWRAEFLDWYVGHSCLKADMLPVANTQLGPGSLAAILGSVFEGGEDTIWIHPDPQFRDDFSFDINHPNFQLHKDLLRACVRRSEGNYYVGMPDLMEGLDVLAAMKGTDRVLMDTLTQPEVLTEQMRRINDAYFQVFDALYDIIRFDGRDCGGTLDIQHGDLGVGTDAEMAFCYFSLWAPGKMTKLQSDISTMLSEEDYRQFVQPFIREQCQKIDYTLYHLDGVGAMRHLPALLEIDELNAIQWTPGVGQPQGGDAKWYDLYRKILAAGKSVMACWVTLPQLRPLLDSVGGDGLHLEMDFHNEAEVEQALRIVEEYQATPTQPTGYKQIRPSLGRITASRTESFPSLIETPKRPPIEELLKQRILIEDGAQGTSIQRLHLQGVSKCNEYLCIEHPEVILGIYGGFLAAGSDLICTNTFNAQSVSLAAHGFADRARDINRAATLLARQLADAYTVSNPAKPRYVLGGIGPTRETLSMPETAHITAEELHASYQEQMEAMLEAGVDALLIETIFDCVNCTIGIEAAHDAMRVTGRRVPLMLSFSVRQANGYNMLGQDVIAYCRNLKPEDDIFAVGINCNPDIHMVTELIRRLANETPYYIIVFPNAGIPDDKGNFPCTPAEFQRLMWPMFDQHLVNMVGGCCGTTDRHMAALAELVETAPGCYVGPRFPGRITLDKHAVGAEVHDTGLSSSSHIADEAKGTSVTSEADTTADKQPEDRLLDAIVSGNQQAAIDATREALAAGNDPSSLINNQMICAMSMVGKRFEEGTAFVPQLLMAGRAMKSALSFIKEQQAASGQSLAMQSLGKVVIGTVKGDLHDIGKNLVASMLEGSGFEVINVGIDVDADTFVKALVDNHADILCLSALLTTTMTYMKEVVDALQRAGIRDKVKVMVGGAPVTQRFADEIGADGYSSNANEAVSVAKSLMALS